jgi:hypothetical protein
MQFNYFFSSMQLFVYYTTWASSMYWLSSLSRAVTWEVTCFYSQTVAGPLKSCCVSLSSFYSRTLVECPDCVCGACPAASAAPQCNAPEAEPAVRCTGHMCPIRVHWHVKTSYTEYWRVKMTIMNLNRLKNYTDWNLVVQHPGMQNVTQVFSFDSHPLVQYGEISKIQHLAINLKPSLLNYIPYIASL